MQFAAGVNAGLEAVKAFYILTSYEDVHVSADLALFIEYAVPQSTVPDPQRIEYITDSRKIPVEGDFDLAV
jgi:hypothetical protein